MSKTIIERRMVAAANLRASDGDEPAIMGYAASFGVLSQDLGGFREMIAPGAFQNSLKNGADVRALFNHDASRILGRRAAGTLSVEEDSRGLKFRCDLDPDNSDHMNIRAMILRGDVDQCSFAFTTPPDGDVWDEATDENGLRFQRRTLRKVNLIDVSAVTYPAYNAPDATVVAARNAGAGEVEARRKWLNDHLSDAQRREKAHQIGMALLRDLKIAGE